MKFKLKAPFFCMAVAVLLWSCQGKGKVDKKQAESSVSKGVVAVQGTALRDAPQDKTKFLTYLSWGEEIEILEQPVENDKFTKIRVVSVLPPKFKRPGNYWCGC